MAVGRGLREQNSSKSVADDICYDDLTGVFCRLCKSRTDGVRVYYVPATSSHRAHCKECKDTGWSTLLIYLGISLALALVIYLLRTAYQKQLSKSRKVQLSRAWKTFKPDNKCKIVIGFYLIATKIPKVYDVELPVTVKQTLSAFAIGVSFGLNGADSVLECFKMRGYLQTLILYMMAPLVVASLILLGWLVRLLWYTHKRVSLTLLLEMAAPLLLKVVFLAYPLVTNAAFDVFFTHHFNDGEWLRVDVDIRLGTSQYERARALAWAAIFLYPIGLLILTAVLLFAARGAIRSGQATPLSRAIAFLYREYEKEFFWWELVEARITHQTTEICPALPPLLLSPQWLGSPLKWQMLRRLVLVGMMVLVRGMMQIIMGLSLSAIFLLFQVQAKPYSDMADDFLASASSFALVMTFICSYAFKARAREPPI